MIGLAKIELACPFCGGLVAFELDAALHSVPWCQALRSWATEYLSASYWTMEETETVDLGEPPATGKNQ